jgi:hypothetical protein
MGLKAESTMFTTFWPSVPRGGGPTIVILSPDLSGLRMTMVGESGSGFPPICRVLLEVLK